METLLGKSLMFPHAEKEGGIALSLSAVGREEERERKSPLGASRIPRMLQLLLITEYK